MKHKQQQEFSDFRVMFAFSDEQFKKGMKQLNVNGENELTSIGAGGFIRKSDVTKYNSMMKKFDDEYKQAIKEDITGKGFIKDMFIYELVNHEYSLTLDLDETLSALELTIDDINKNENLRNGLELAKQELSEQENIEEELFGEE